MFSFSTWINKIQAIELDIPKYFSVLTACVFLLASFVISAPRVASAAPRRPAVSLEQCANKDLTCDSNENAKQWQTGNLNRNNSTYVEGNSVPYRVEFTDLTADQTYLISIEWDTTKSGKHAFDYLTSYNLTEEKAFPCAGIECGDKTDSLQIEPDPNVTVGQPADQLFQIFGGTFPLAGQQIENSGNLCSDYKCEIARNHGEFKLTGTYEDSSSTSVDLVFTAHNPTVVLSWGGHLATEVDWGVGKSASAISGSPYHMRLLDFRCSNVDNCSTGKLDRSLHLNDDCDESEEHKLAEKKTGDSDSCDDDCDESEEHELAEREAGESELNESDHDHLPCSTTTTSTTSTTSTTTTVPVTTTSTTTTVPVTTTTVPVTTTSTTTIVPLTTTSTTTTVPVTTTTVPVTTTSTTTTVPASTTTTTIDTITVATVPEVPTTTIPSVTTSSVVGATTTTTATVPSSTTTAEVGATTTTTSPSNSILISVVTPRTPQNEADSFQNNFPTITNTPSDTYDVLIPDGLPITGAQLSVLFFLILLLLVSGGILVSLSKVQVQRSLKDEVQ